MNTLRPSAGVCCVVVCWCLFSDAPTLRAVERGADTDAWRAEAERRIAQHRRADWTIRVLDQQGNAVADADVRVQQTRHAFLLGCNIFAWGRIEDPRLEQAYRKQFADLFNFATLPFYWSSYERSAGSPDHERTARVAKWCVENGIVCKGHPLAWNHADPGWLPDDPDTVRRMQLERIEDCVQRFSGQIRIWDVVNEATHFDRREFIQRAPKLTGMWQNVGRIELTQQCFQQARQANPDATLLINDYRVDAAYEKVIEELVDEQGRRLYDVVGIQSHQHGGTWNNQKIWDVCERFSRFGVPLHFTETTIVSGHRGWELAREGQAWATTAVGEQEQAAEVERFYTMLFSHPAVEAITWWDFSDLRAWQRAPAGLLRKDMTAKPAYQTLHRLFRERWWTDTRSKTGKDGCAEFRAMLGEYRVTVQHGDQTVEIEKHRVRRDADNVLEIRLP